MKTPPVIPRRAINLPKFSAAILVRHCKVVGVAARPPAALATDPAGATRGSLYMNKNQDTERYRASHGHDSISSY